jgi:hypothetical protein
MPMRVVVTGMAKCAGPEALVWDARTELPERKHLKLMSPAVRLGVGMVLRALSTRSRWEEVPPERRGLFVGARPEGDLSAIAPALQDAWTGTQVSLERLGERSTALVPPLWLVAGLSNNIVGYASAYADIRGPVSNRCEGSTGGFAAILEAARAVHEGRVDLAVAGGADDVRGVPWDQGSGAIGAAFVVIERSGAGPILVDGGNAHAARAPAEPNLPDYGAATGPVRLIERIEEGQSGRAWVRDVRSDSAVWIDVEDARATT